MIVADCFASIAIDRFTVDIFVRIVNLESDFARSETTKQTVNQNRITF
jgi:hypothetical protein